MHEQMMVNVRYVKELSISIGVRIRIDVELKQSVSNPDRAVPDSHNFENNPVLRIRGMLDPWSGIGFFRIPDPKLIFLRALSDIFLGEKPYDSLKNGPYFFLRRFKNKIIYNFVTFVATKKGRTTIFFGIRDPRSGMDKNQDPGQTSRMCNTEIIQPPDWSGGSGGIVPGASGHRNPAVLCAALPDADNLALHVLLATEGAHVLRVLRDLHLLHSLTQGGAVP